LSYRGLSNAGQSSRPRVFSIVLDGDLTCLHLHRKSRRAALPGNDINKKIAREVRPAGRHPGFRSCKAVRHAFRNRDRSVRNT
jgi:hypothetical protein